MNILGKENAVIFVMIIVGRLQIGRIFQKADNIGEMPGLPLKRYAKKPLAKIAGVVVVAAASAMVPGLAAPAAAQDDFLRPSINGFRISQHNALTRLVLTITGPIRFRAFTTDRPYRLVLEMQPVNWSMDRAIRLGGRSILSSLSFAEAHSEAVQPVARMTAVLRRPARIQKSFALRPRGKARSWRLVVDLEPVSKDEFDRLMRSDRVMPKSGILPKSGVLTAADMHSGAVPAAAGGRRWTVVLDPGHGGIDNGASSPWGLKEKNVVLSTARLVQRYLGRDRRFRVLLTRRDDRYIPLRDRYEFARRHGAALFVSIHADAHPRAEMRGLSVYTLAARASDQLAARLAERENRSDAVAGIRFRGTSKSVSNILMDLVRRETQVGSARISSSIVRSARHRVRLLRKPQRSARFVVLKAPDVPSVLVELGFLTNRQDEKLLRTMRYRKRLAAILARAIARYFDGTPAPRRTRRQTARSNSGD